MIAPQGGWNGSGRTARRPPCGSLRSPRAADPVVVRAPPMPPRAAARLVAALLACAHVGQPRAGGWRGAGADAQPLEMWAGDGGTTSRETAGEGASCPCPSGFFGPGCAHNWKTTREYMPDAGSLRAPCSPALFRKVRQTLHERQFGADGTCTPRRLDAWELPRTGFGAIAFYAVYEMLVATQKGRAFDYPNGSLKAFASRGCGASLRCYVEPTSACGAKVGMHGMAWKPSRPVISGRNGKKDGGDGKGGWKIPNAYVKGAPVHAWRFKPQSRPPIKPSAFGQGDTNIFAVHAAAVSFLWRPKQNIKRIVDALTGPNLDPMRAVSVHVRHGDSCTDTNHPRTCFSADRYLAHVRALKEKYARIDTVLLATDDGKVVNAFRKVLASNAQPPLGGLKLVVAKANRAWYDPSTWSKRRNSIAKKASSTMQKAQTQRQNFKDGYIEQRLKWGDGDPGRVGTEAAVDTELLSRGGYFVGTFSSNLGRFAFEVMADRTERVPPFVSLDRHWYFGQSRADKLLCKRKATTECGGWREVG